MDLLGKICKTRNVALAVSGGVDSMALAYLVTRHISPSKVHAFTVDHSARPESHEEAITVGRNLGEMGIFNHHILKLDWSRRPLPTSKFELEARNLRREIMIDKCRDLDIDHLFLAHHWDDQLETFLLRLIRGSSLFGLSGMHEISYNNNIIDPNTRGPVTLVKPLLHYFKKDLYQLCSNNNISWVEDPTNKDHTLTIRNSIRFLFSRPKCFPGALQLSNLSETLQTLQQNRANYEAEARLQFNRLCENKAIYLDKRLGRLECEIPAEYHTVWPNSTKILFIYRLLRLVSPLSLEYRLSMVDDLVQHLNLKKEKIPNYANVSIRYRDGKLIMSRARIFRYQRRSLRTRLSVSKEWSHWILFDNRYWIRAKSDLHSMIEISLLFDSSVMKHQLRSRLGNDNWPSKHLLDSQPFITQISSSDDENSVPLGFPIIGKFDSDHGIQIEWKYKDFVSDGSAIQSISNLNSEIADKSDKLDRPVRSDRSTTQSNSTLEFHESDTSIIRDLKCNELDRSISQSV